MDGDDSPHGLFTGGVDHGGKKQPLGWTPSHRSLHFARTIPPRRKGRAMTPRMTMVAWEMMMDAIEVEALG